MSVKTLLQGLNSRQRQAVETTKGPCLVIAGPGSGKTRVITRRIAYLLEQGIAPERILAITFTKKAAKEMQDRVCELLRGVPPGLTIRTFHSLGFRVLCENTHLAGLSRPFHVTNQMEQLEILSRIRQAQGTDGTLFNGQDLLRRISVAKNHGLSAETICTSARNDAERLLADVFQQYELALRKRNAVDLDDLIVRSLRDVLQADKSVREAYQSRFRYIMVDEYQDTNWPEYELTKSLLSPKRNLCVVGDDDQSIYGFRGSNVNHILSFADDFPGARLITFETNYRSFEQIVSFASRVIECAPNRYPKRLRSSLGTGFPVEWSVTDTEMGEFNYIKTRVCELVNIQKISVDDIAVLFRRHKDAIAIRWHLETAGISCRSRKHRSGVRLLTLHAAKGLEFGAVFLPLLEEQTLPHYHAINEGPAGIEEERRLLYVGLTRAKSRLYLSSSRSRWGRPRETSRFLTELGSYKPITETERTATQVA